MLLSQADSDTQQHTAGGSQRRDEPAFQQEDTANRALVRSEVREDTDTLPFVNDEHGQRADDIETGDKQYEYQQQDGQQFLNA